MEKEILENDEIQLEVMPSCGGKIYTLMSKLSGRQWLWHNPNLPLQIPRYGDSYITRLDSGGWDEIFPSVTPCRIGLSGGGELAVPDHGDIVALPAAVERPDGRTLVTVTKGRLADFEFARRIRLSGSMIELHYTVTNTGACPFPFLWSAHPLIRFEQGMTIDLEYSIPFTVESAFGASPFKAGDSFRWAGSNGPYKIPSPGHPAFEPFAMKIFSRADSIHALTVVAADRQESLRLEWDTPVIRHLGLWMNYGAWCGLGKTASFSLGIEPTTSPFDDLAKAVEQNRAIQLQPGQSRQWSMELSVHQYRTAGSRRFSRQPQRVLK
jgi:hypothetical protein